MAVEILERDLHVPLSELAGSDIAYDVLDFSNFSDGQFVLEEEEFNLHQSLEKFVAQFARRRNGAASS